MRKYLFSLTSQERKALIIVGFFFLLGISVPYLSFFRTYNGSREIFYEGRKDELLVDINQASLSELIQIPHIGVKIAKRIIAYRQKNGRFRAKKELLNVKGIGPKKLPVISKFIKIN
ncbi:MAG: helix-hairpin-helix domain-containing protein [Candidatus Omnitrophica bacterium]|nr:helix-hairpin-helix domain-containing protein [Candidatus Omnitrophota bacterium]